jgi:hypothetical protein
MPDVGGKVGVLGTGAEVTELVGEVLSVTFLGPGPKLLELDDEGTRDEEAAVATWDGEGLKEDSRDLAQIRHVKDSVGDCPSATLEENHTMSKQAVQVLSGERDGLPG